MKYGINKINTKFFSQQLMWLVVKEFNTILGGQGSNFTDDIVIINNGILIEYSILNWIT